MTVAPVFLEHVAFLVRVAQQTQRVHAKATAEEEALDCALQQGQFTDALLVAHYAHDEVLWNLVDAFQSHSFGLAKKEWAQLVAELAEREWQQKDDVVLYAAVTSRWCWQSR